MNSLSVSLAICAVIIGSAVSEWSGQKWCNQSLIDKNNSTACVVETRNDLPPLVDGANYDIYYALHNLTAGGSASSMLSLTHSMLLIREKGNPSGLRFLIEFAAVYFGPAAMIPTVEANGSLAWKTDGVLAWLPEANQTDWLANATITHIGNASSSILEKWFAWVVDWRSTRKGYQAWSVWDSSDVFSANRLLNESICHTFTEDGLISLYDLGASFYQTQPLCRNYFPYLSNSTPTVVDMHNKSERKDIDHWFHGVDKILRLNFTNLTQFGDTLRDFLATTTDHIYIYEWATTERYWKAHVNSPYLSEHLYQPIVLPWQPANSINAGMCDQPGIARPSSSLGDTVVV